jgi:hypothetical protein
MFKATALSRRHFLKATAVVAVALPISIALAGVDVENIPKNNSNWLDSVETRWHSRKVPIEVPPGKRLKGKIEFAKENAGYYLDVSFYDESVGHRILPRQNNHLPADRTWVGPTNDTSQRKNFYVVSWYRQSCPGGRDWAPSFMDHAPGTDPMKWRFKAGEYRWARTNDPGGIVWAETEFPLDGEYADVTLELVN